MSGTSAWCCRGTRPINHRTLITVIREVSSACIADGMVFAVAAVVLFIAAALLARASDWTGRTTPSEATNDGADRSID